MALVIGPPELPRFSQYSPQEEENAEKWGYEKKSTGWREKEEGPTKETHKELT